MFKKVQLKFFAIITSILLTIFIALLASINLIMEAVMQRQSQVVLRQIASSIEYDSATSTFTYFPERKEPDKKPDSAPEPKPHDENSTQQDSVTDSSEEASTTEAADAPTENSSQENTDGTSQTDTSPAQPETSPPPSENPGENVTNPVQTATEPSSESPTYQTTTQTSAPPPPFENPDRQDPDFPEKPDQNKPNGDSGYPQFPFYPDWNGNNNRNENFYTDFDGYYYYPMPDKSFEQKCPPQNSAEAPTEAPTDFTEQQSAAALPDASDSLAQLSQSAASPQILEGYTVIRSAPKTIFKAEKSDSRISSAPVPKSLGSIDFFVLMADTNGKFLAALNNDTLESSVAQTYINAIIGDGATHGMLNNFQFCSLDKENGTIMVFTDKSAEIDMLKQLTRTTVLIGAVSFILLSILAFFLSKKSIEPIKIAFEKQKQFISDASHELKTPLTIISANADVLSDEIGSNKWLVYIKTQTERMNVLVNDLLNLTRLENNTADFVCSDFDLSTAIENTALPFECQAFETGRSFEIDIEEGLSLNGSEKHIKQMAAIFIDNALKYSGENGTVKVTLKAQGEKKLLSVYNTGQGIREGEESKIFERFYRSDDSRARATGGYGLGLAIAKSIIDKHKFKVSVINTEGESICFNILM